MYFFFIKKVFFDSWDNLLSLIVLNIGFIIIIAGFAYTTFLFDPGSTGFFISYIILIFIFNFYTGGVSGYTKELIFTGSGDLRDVFRIAKNSWRQNLIIAVFSIIELSVLVIGFPFYLSIGGIPGLVGGVTIFWVSLFAVLSSQYFLPLGFQLQGGIKKQVKKSFLIFFDNTFFTIFLGIHTLILLMISFLTAFLMPGISVILLSHQAALKLRLYKYDYLEDNSNVSGESRKKGIPWDALLLDERDLLCQRSLKGMIFPWKE